ncbi:MAG: folate family ECF transporter S component [Clostridia bacterium]|nr:folate family ECF transporter S component [Clostridia bacterium]
MSFESSPHPKSRRVQWQRHTRRLCLAALLAALSFLLGYVAKAIQGEAPVRFTVEGLPIVFAGYVLGPIVGAAVGVCADLLSCLLAGMAPLPLITVGAAAVGLVPGVIALLTGRHGDTHRAPRFLFILLLDGAAHTVGSVGIKSLALSLFTEVGFFTLLWPRLLMYLLVVGLESYLLYMLMRSAAVRRELERLLK